MSLVSSIFNHDKLSLQATENHHFLHQWCSTRRLLDGGPDSLADDRNVVRPQQNVTGMLTNYPWSVWNELTPQQRAGVKRTRRQCARNDINVDLNYKWAAGESNGVSVQSRQCKETALADVRIHVESCQEMSTWTLQWVKSNRFFAAFQVEYWCQ